MAESKSTCFAFPFNGDSEKSTKFDPFQSIGWMLIQNAPPPRPAGGVARPAS